MLKELSPKRITNTNNNLRHPDYEDGIFAQVQTHNEYNEPSVTIFERTTMKATKLNKADVEYILSLLQCSPSSSNN